MAPVVVGLFEHADNARTAIDRLRREGYDEENIGVIAAEAASGPDVEVEKKSRVPEGAAIGAGAGGAAAALAVGLTSVGVISTGGVGLLAAGPIVAALAGAGAGAAGGGLLGTLVGLGLAEDEAKIVDEEVSDGAVVVAVESEPAKADPKTVFDDAGAKRTFLRGG